MKTAKRTLIKASFIITVFSFGCKLLGTFLRFYLSARIGSEGMGLHSLIMSVYTVFTTLATAGFTFAVSRLSAEYSASDENGGFGIYLVSLIPACIMGILSCVFMLALSPYAAERLVGDIRALPILRTLAFSLPFMSVTSCMKGLFLAKRQVFKNGSGSLAEQTVRIAVTYVLLGIYMANETDIYKLCFGVSAGITVGEVFSLIYLGLLSLPCVRRCGISPTDGLKRLIKVGSPVAASVYVTTLLHSGESVLIPAMLQNFSGDRASALSEFGVIRGMVIPLLFFPFSFLGALCSVMIPELGYLRSFGDTDGIRRRVKEVMQLASLFGIAAGGIFFIFASEAGKTFYPGSDTLLPLLVLAPVTPFMYAETVADQILKALGEEKSTMLHSLVNSAFRIICIMLFVPMWGGVGYLAILFASNILQYALAMHRLEKKCGYFTDFPRGVLLPAVGIILGGLIGKSVIGSLHLHHAVCLGIGCVIAAGIFMIFCLPIYRRRM